MITTKNQKVVIVSVILLLCLCGGYFIHSQQVASELDENEFEEMFNEIEENKEAVEVESKPKVIVVDLKGAVHNPGVYEMEEGSRVIDVIDKAGGMTKNANENHVNLAMYLRDEMVVYVPLNGEEDVSNLGEQMNSEGKVNLNTATSAELEEIPGVGPAKASQILVYREQNGKFQKVEDIMNVSGIGEKSFEKMKEFIYVR